MDLNIILEIDTLNLNKTLNQDKLLLLALNNELLDNNNNNMVLTCIPCEPSSTSAKQLENNNNTITSNTAHVVSRLTSIGITIEGVFDLDKLKVYIDSIIYNNTSQSHAINSTSNETAMNNNMILRMKGVFRIYKDDKYLYILQSICDVFDILPSTIEINSSADTTYNVNKFIVIGKHVEYEYFYKGLSSCLYNNVTTCI